MKKHILPYLIILLLAFVVPTQANLTLQGTPQSGVVYLNSNNNITLAAVVTAIGPSMPTTLIILPGTWPVTSNLNISSNINLVINKGAMLAISNGTLTINGTMDAGLYQIFNCTGTGKVAFGIGSVARIYPQWWGANTIPGTTDMTAAVQAALTAGAGKIVYLVDGAHKITATLLVSDRTTLEGESWKAKLTTALDIEIVSNTGDASTGIINLTIKNLEFENTYPVTGGIGSTKFHVHLFNPISALIDHCHFKSAFNDTDYNTANRGGVWFEKIAPYYAILNHIDNSFVQNGSVRFDTSDSSITNSIVWGHTCDYAIMLNDGDINVLNNQGIIGSRSHGGIYLTLTGGSAGAHKIIGNYIGGTNDDMDNGYGVYSIAPVGVTITGNTFHQMDGPGIYCQDGVNNSITANAFYGGNPKSISVHTGYPDIIIDGVTYNPQNYTISGNTFFRSAAQGDSVEDAIHMRGFFAPANNTFNGNTFNGIRRYNTPAINYSVDTRNVLTGNIGHGTEVMSGTWVPTLIGTTGGVAATSAADGYYTYDATGRVWFDLNIVTTSVSGLSGNLAITLSFTASNGTGVQSASVNFAVIDGITLGAGYTGVLGSIDKNTNQIKLLEWGSTKGITHLPVETAASATQFRVSGSFVKQ